MRRGEAGLSLVELIVTVAILGIAFVAVVGGMWTSIFASDVHRKQATGETVLRSYAEFLKKESWPTPACPASYPQTFPTPGFTPPAGYAPTVARVEYWIADPQPVAAPTVSGRWEDGPPCSAEATASGVHRLTLQVASSDGRATESVQIVKRRP